MDRNKILSSHQHGFRPKHSTKTALIDLLDFVTNFFEKKMYIVGLFIDIFKAFDCLNHNILLPKLEHYGIRGVTLDWFRSYLFNRFQFTCQSDAKSLYHKIVCGIPQGSILGPYLYLIYVNDIFNVSSETKCILYADDTTLLFADTNLKTLLANSSAQFSLFSLWFRDNLLALNPKKTNFVIFYLMHAKFVFPKLLHFDTHTVNRVDCVKFLGFMIDSTLSWNSHINCILCKVSTGIGMVKIFSKFLPMYYLLSIYHSFIAPYLTSGIEFWGTACEVLLHPLRIAQKHCVRLIAGVSRLEHCAPIARNLNILLLNDLCNFHILSVIFKVYNNDGCEVVNNLLKLVNSVHLRQTRSCNVNFYVPFCRLNIQKNFIVYRGVKLWNELSIVLRQSSSLSLFKKNIISTLFANYV